MENMKLWNAVNRPPSSALKPIGAGRLKGKSDINPQWRYQAMTEQFGPCGTGWKFTIDRLWLEDAFDGQKFAFASVSLFYKDYNPDPAWSEAIPGIGGSMLIEQESKGPHANDEAYKMAVTDALGTAMKMIGVAADIYAGKWDGTKYAKEDVPREPVHNNSITADQKAKLFALMTAKKMDTAMAKKFFAFVAPKTGKDAEAFIEKFDDLSKAFTASLVIQSKTISCPNHDGREIPIVDCETCNQLNGCPSHEDIPI